MIVLLHVAKYFFQKIGFSYEAKFRLCDNVKRHDVIVWESEKTSRVLKHVRDITKIKVFVPWAVKKGTDIRRGGGGGVNQLTELSHRHTLDLLLTSQLPENKRDVFQHGRAPPHIHNEVTTFRNQTIVWATTRPKFSSSCRPLPPDLTLPIFCVWGFVEDEVYLPPKPISLSNLKNRIRTASAKTEHPLVRNVWHEAGYRRDVRRVKTEHTLNLHRVWKELPLPLFIRLCVLLLCD